MNLVMKRTRGEKREIPVCWQTGSGIWFLFHKTLSTQHLAHHPWRETQWAVVYSVNVSGIYTVSDLGPLCVSSFISLHCFSTSSLTLECRWKLLSFIVGTQLTVICKWLFWIPSACVSLHTETERAKGSWEAEGIFLQMFYGFKGMI